MNLIKFKQKLKTVPQKEKGYLFFGIHLNLIEKRNQ